MTPCTQFDAFCAERASGALSPSESRFLDAHLDGCPRCRAALAEYELAFGLARLPEPTADELRSLGALPPRVRGALDAAKTRWSGWRPLLLGASVAAAIVFVVRPAALKVIHSDDPAPAAAIAAWQEPDVDSLLARVEREHAELAVAYDEELVREERLADAAYLKALEDQ